MLCGGSQSELISLNVSRSSQCAGVVVSKTNLGYQIKWPNIPEPWRGTGSL